MVKTKRTKSTLLLLWEVSKKTHFGVLPFCFVVEYFGLIGLNVTDTCQKNCDLAKAHNRL